MNSEERFLDLAGRFLEGIAVEEDLEALAEIVKRDPPSRQLLADLIDQHATLRRLHAGQTGCSVAAARPAIPLEAARPSRRWFRLGAAAGVAAACLIAAASYALFKGAPGKPEGQGAPAAVIAKEPKKATIAGEPVRIVVEHPVKSPAPAPGPDKTPGLKEPAPSSPGPVPVVVDKTPAPEKPIAPEPASAPGDPEPKIEIVTAPPEPDPKFVFTESVIKPTPIVGPSPTAPQDPTPSAPKDPKPAPSATPTEPRIVLAKLDRVEGDVRLLQFPSGQTVPAAAGQSIYLGQGVRTGPGGSASVVYDDKTRLDVGAESSLCAISSWAPRAVAADKEAVKNRGKFVWFTYGNLQADIAPQPKGLPMIFGTPLAEVHVLGTRFSLSSSQAATRVDVSQGRVALVRRKDRAHALLSAGQGAEVTQEAGPIKVQSATPKAVPPKAVESIVVKFGPASQQAPAGARLDSGEEYSERRGHGWLGSMTRHRVLKNIYHERKWVTEGREARSLGGSDPLRAGCVVAGSGFHTETWQINLPNGRYLVTVCAGDPEGLQGPHHVAVEGQPVIAAAVPKAGDFAVREDVPVTVRDGRLTVVVGGHRVETRDRPGETALNYLVIKKMAE